MTYAGANHEVGCLLKPAAHERLSKLPDHIIETAKLLRKVNLSRAQLRAVHRYTQFWVNNKSDDEVGVEGFPDAAEVWLNVRNACQRDQDGTIRKSVFPVPPGVPGVRDKEIVFKVDSL